MAETGMFDTRDAQINQLQQQQALFTQALRAMVEGKWSGESSAEAFLYALDPNMTGQVTPDTPVIHSEVPEPPKA